MSSLHTLIDINIYIFIFSLRPSVPECARVFIFSILILGRIFVAGRHS
jgi:hypothetical protein